MKYAFTKRSCSLKDRSGTNDGIVLQNVHHRRPSPEIPCRDRDELLIGADNEGDAFADTKPRRWKRAPSRGLRLRPPVPPSPWPVMAAAVSLIGTRDFGAVLIATAGADTVFGTALATLMATLMATGAG